MDEFKRREFGIPEEKDWKEESNERLRGRNSPFRVVNMNVYIIFLILSILLLVGVFYYFGINDYFSPTLVDNSTCIMPDIPACPACPTSPSIPACPSPIVNFTIPTINVNCNSS